MTRHRPSLVFAVLLAIAFGLAPANAGTFSIEPTRLSFSTMTSGDVVITNVGDTPVRLSVHAFNWTQNGTNAEELAPAQNMPFFPQIFAVSPKDAQRVRVGLVDPPGEIERSYRLTISEIPDYSRAHATFESGVKFLSRIDIPVFLAPLGLKGSAAPELGQLAKRRQAVDLALMNTGTVHVDPSDLSVEGRDSSGRVIWQKKQRVFYVLARSTIHVLVATSGDDMSRTKLVRVTWSAMRDNPAERTYSI